MSARNPITLEALEILDAIDRRGSFAKAAEELDKATSALSYGVQKLEEQLDVSLFRRQGRRSVLTPAGKLVLEEGRLILEASTRLADRAREVATGWESRIRIAVESLHDYSHFFSVLTAFLKEHSSIEVDVAECVLGGGWEALEQDRVELLVGAPGPVPRQMGYRAIELDGPDLVPVIGAVHPLSQLANDAPRLAEALPTLRRVITHDTSSAGIVRKAGLVDGPSQLFVQNIEQKQQAIIAGLGIGHLPQHRADRLLAEGVLLKLTLDSQDKASSYLAWKISNKGKGLAVLSRMLAGDNW
ncbi:MAG: LysR family transcriptional regulator [Pseudomonadota bacterium]